MSDRSLKALRERFEQVFSASRAQPPESDVTSGWFPLGAESNSDLGWYWESDEQGIYIRCGWEIESILGYAPETVIGQPVYAVGLTPKSARNLETQIQHGRGLHDFVAEAITRGGRSVKLVMNAIRADGEGISERGYRGVTQLLGAQSGETEAPEASPQSEQTASKSTHPGDKKHMAPALGYEGHGDELIPIQESSTQVPEETQIDSDILRVPIHSREGPLGVLEFEAPEGGREWTPEDQLLVEAVAQQLAGALLDARSKELTEQALEEMRQADQLKRQFLANMSHDFRTPLNSIIGFSRVILKEIDGPINETQRQDLEAIHQSGLHLLNMVNDILDLTSIEAGRMKLTFAKLNLAELVDGVISTTSGLIAGRSIDLVADIPTDLPEVHANQTRIRQVLLNLVSNAIKYTEDGYVMISARPLPAQDQPMVLVAVSDTGPGISAEDQAQLFEPFTQIDSLTPTIPGGSGLGLSICKHLVELHGGKIWVESELEAGSTFAFTLPLYPQEPEKSKRVQARVLVLDDQISAHEEYGKLLGGPDLEFRQVSSPDQIMETAAAYKPHLLIMDPLLPSDISWRLITKLKHWRDTRAIPVCMCTPYEADGGFCLGVVDFLAKPVDEGELLRNLRRWIPAEAPAGRVLVIGDQQDEMRRICSAIDAGEVTHSEWVSSGGRALASVHGGAPHMIILDLSMAAGHAFQTLRALKESDRTTSVPLLALIPSQPSPEELAQFRRGTEYLENHRRLSLEQLKAELEIQLAGLTAKSSGVGETKPLPPFPG